MSLLMRDLVRWYVKLLGQRYTLESSRINDASRVREYRLWEREEGKRERES